MNKTTIVEKFRRDFYFNDKKTLSKTNVHDAKQTIEQFLLSELSSLEKQTEARVRESLQKEIKIGNPLFNGKGVCKCEYDKEGKRFGMCLRCANYQLYAHREG